MKKLTAVLFGSIFLAGIALAQPSTTNDCDIGGLRRLALETVKSNIIDCKIQKDKKCFRAGAFWNQFWVRDTSYSSLMGLYEIYPEELKNTFRELVLMNGKTGYPKQDSSADFGSFPYQTDSIVWVIGGFELAKKTGDNDFRRYVYDVGKKMRRKWLHAADTHDGLIFGAPSFLDSWASFPGEWRGKRDVFLKNKFLSTNVLWLRFEQIMIWEGKRYGDMPENKFLENLAAWQSKINTLNQKFYNPGKKYYTYYIGSDVYEGLGNGLMQKFNFNQNKIENIKTDENFYPAHYPMFDPVVSNNWYGETVQHIWVDGFLAGINNEPDREFCDKYDPILKNNNNIAELIHRERMFGGDKQLWAAMGVYFYLTASGNNLVW